jgi:hypothetical protein
MEHVFHYAVIQEKSFFRFSSVFPASGGNRSHQKMWIAPRKRGENCCLHSSYGNRIGCGWDMQHLWNISDALQRRTVYPWFFPYFLMSFTRCNTAIRANSSFRYLLFDSSLDRMSKNFWSFFQTYYIRRSFPSARSCCLRTVAHGGREKPFADRHAEGEMSRDEGFQARFFTVSYRSLCSRTRCGFLRRQ